MFIITTGAYDWQIGLLHWPTYGPAKTEQFIRNIFILFALLQIVSRMTLLLALIKPNS